jgi:hypothetical protein
MARLFSFEGLAAVLWGPARVERRQATLSGGRGYPGRVLLIRNWGDHGIDWTGAMDRCAL